MKPLSEFDLIAQLTADAPSKAKDLMQGVGDDCAIIAGPYGFDWLITTDALVEGVHFRREWTDFETLGRKALAVNLSDIAAMGGRPRFYLVSIGLPPCDSDATVSALYDGIRAQAAEYDIFLIGGDTVSSSSEIFISITVLGDVPRGHAILRSGAKPGDAIYVTGQLGFSALGLICLDGGKRNDDAKPFILRHLSPIARIKEGIWIAKTCIATSMIDVSDGLLADLGHIADESGVGFEIDVGRVPTVPRFAELSRELKQDPIVLMLSGGEDYELAFTVDVQKVAQFEQLIQNQDIYTISRIGSVVGDIATRNVIGADGNLIDIKTKGFDHFAR